MKLNQDPFERIKSGKKTIEVRLFDYKRQMLNLGEIMSFSKLPDLKEKISVEVMGLLRYRNFKELLDDFSMDYFGYSKDYSKEKFIEEIYKIYTKEEEKKWGVLGIKIKLI